METMVTLEERVRTLEQDYIEQKKFRKKFDSIISLEVAPDREWSSIFKR